MKKIIEAARMDVDTSTEFGKTFMALLEAAENLEQIEATLKAFYYWYNEKDGHLWGNMPVSVQTNLKKGE
jgi:predicted S18 family serine protease